MRTMLKRRTTEEARDALSRFCKVIGTHGDKNVHIWTIPADRNRDADLILSDVITERDELREQLREAMQALENTAYSPAVAEARTVHLKISEAQQNPLNRARVTKETA